MADKKRVRTLLRVSSRQQLHDDDIPIQRAETADFIAGHPDWELDKEYVEKAVSAYKNSVEDREMLLQIMEDGRNSTCFLPICPTVSDGGKNIPFISVP